MRSRVAHGSKLLRLVSRDPELATRASVGRGRSSVAIQTCPDAKSFAPKCKFALSMGKGYALGQCVHAEKPFQHGTDHIRYLGRVLSTYPKTDALVPL